MYEKAKLDHFSVYFGPPKRIWENLLGKYICVNVALAWPNFRDGLMGF